MHVTRLITLTILVLAQPARADDVAELIGKQRNLADSNAAKGIPGALVRAETPRFYLIGCGTEPRLKALGASLERHTTVMTKALQFDAVNPPWAGKLAVYLVPDPVAMKSFLRAVEKRSSATDEAVSIVSSGDTPHIALVADPNKNSSTLEPLAVQGVATLMCNRCGKFDRLPGWVTAGFAKSTLQQTQGLAARKRAAAKLGLPATAAWKAEVPAEKRLLVAASVMDFLIYGKAVKPAGFFSAFRPDEGAEEKPLAQVLEAVQLTEEKLDLAWRMWLNK